MLNSQSCSQDRNPALDSSHQLPLSAILTLKKQTKKKIQENLYWEVNQKEGFLAARGGLPGNLIYFPLSPARPWNTVSDRKGLDQTRSERLFPSQQVLEGTQILPGCSCLVSNQSWISTCNSFQCHWYKNTPVLLLRSFKILTFSTGVEAIHFPSTQPFKFIFKSSFTVFEPEPSPSPTNRSCCSLGSSPPHQGNGSLLGGFIMFSKLHHFVMPFITLHQPHFPIDLIQLKHQNGLRQRSERALYVPALLGATATSRLQTPRPATETAALFRGEHGRAQASRSGRRSSASALHPGHP